MPWIFLILMMTNAVYLGWNFMNSAQPSSPVKSYQAPEHGGRVVLLSESAASPPATAALEAEPKAADLAGTDGAEALPQAGSPQCFNVGPFASETRLNKFSEAMRGQKFIVRTDKRKVDEKDYWVFIPAFTSQERAEEKLREIKSKGVKGFVVRNGAFINAISLNHFSKRELAQGYLQEMHVLGLPVEYRELSRVGYESWAYLAPGHAKADLKSSIDTLIADAEATRREITACED